MSDIVIETKHVGKNYGKFAAVSDLSIQVKKGDIYALVGQNGAGKTTLLKMVCGLTPLSSGELSLFGGNSGRSLGAARSRVGSMIETPGFFPYLSAKDNLEYYRIQRGCKNKSSVGETLKFVGLDRAGSKKFRSFSLGMKQRLGLALAVMGNPDLLVLDEPINGLDPMGIKEFRDVILKMNRERKTTVLISSHILGELSQIATTYGFIKDGRLVEHIAADDLKEKCRSYLRIDVDDAAKASEVLRGRLSCTAFQVKENTLQIEERLDTPEVFVKALVESGVSVTQVYRSGINLEQYFINLIGGNKNA